MMRVVEAPKPKECHHGRRFWWMTDDDGRKREKRGAAALGEEVDKGVVLHSASIKSSGGDALPVVIGGVDIKYVLAQVGGADL